MVTMQKSKIFTLLHGYCGFAVQANRLALRGMTGSSAH
jgi:hypothetical protein